MADENHLIEIQVGETGADQVASKLGQVDSAADKIPTKIDIIVNAKIDQALANLAQMQQQVAQLTGQASVEANKVLSNFQSTIQRYQSTDFNALTQQQQAGKLGYLSTQGGQTQSAISRISSSYTPPLSTLTSPVSGSGYAIPPTPTIQNPPAWPTFGGGTGGTGSTVGGGSGFILPPAKSNISVSETYNPRGYLQTRTITEKGLTDPITGEPMTQRQQEITQGKILAEQEEALREDRRRQFQASDTEQYRARRLDASGKPLGDVAGAKAQLDLVNKELTSMGSTTGMTSQQLDRYNTLLKRQADLSVDAAGQTKNLGSDMLKHAGFVAYAALIWTTFRAVGEIIDSTMAAMRSYSTETARFAAITDQSVSSAITQYGKLRDEVVRGGFTPQEGAAGITAAARFTKDPEGQRQLIEAGSSFARLIGDKDPTKSINAIASALRATGKDAGYAREMVAQLWAAYQRDPGDPAQFFNTLTEAVPLAEKLGTTYEKTVNIISAGVATTGESAEVMSASLFRMGQAQEKLSGSKLTSVIDAFRSLSIDPQKSDGSLKSTSDLLDAVGEKWTKFSKAQQELALQALFGGEKIKGNYYQAARGIMEAYGQGISDGTEVSIANMNEGLAKIDATFDAIEKRRKAIIEARKTEGDMGRAGVAQFVGDAYVQFQSLLGGSEAGRKAAGFAELSALVDFKPWEEAVTIGEDRSRSFLKSLTGMTPDEVKQAVAEYNKNIDEIAGSRENKLLFTIPEKMVDEFIKSLQNKATLAQTAWGKILAPTSNLGASLMDITKKLAGAGDGVVGGFTPLTADQKRLSDISSFQSDIGTPNQRSFSDIMPTSDVDMTKYTTEQINQAKQLSIQLSMQEIEIATQYIMSLGKTREEAEKIVAVRKDELDMSLLLIRSQEGLNYAQGLEAAHLQDALREMEKKEQEKQSSFQFRRLKDIDPSQFGQLQGLTQMYDKFLTNIGSPEKQMNINLLLGEQNTFKTMNARMTALQLALEDLTKVEKAQLSGTWNMPSGATALVPITSLDLQRWNKSGGGGIDPAALAALLGATNNSGDKVATAMGTAADRITAAIRDQYDKSGVPHSETDVQNASAMAENAIKAALGGLGFGIPDLAQIGSSTSIQPVKKPVNGLESMPDYLEELAKLNPIIKMAQNQQAQPSRITGGYRDMEEYRSLLRDADAYPGQFKSSDPSFRQQQTTVNVSMLPVKATFNANLSVNLNGAVVARALVPILYDMLIKTARSTGITPKGSQRS